MFTLSGFGDEISSDLNEQLDILEKEEIKHLEIRGVYDKGILELDDQEIKNVKDTLSNRGFGISAISSPIGKINILDNFDEHLEKFKKTIYLAKFFETEYIRIFSYYIPEGEKAEKYRDEVLKRMKEKTKIAEKENVMLLHENEHGIYGDIPERCKDIIESIGSEKLKSIFDPANYVLENVKPYTDAFPLLKDSIKYLHIKDAVYKTQTILPAGEGDGQIKEILSNLKQINFNGFLSLEPHLEFAGSTKGFTGPELFVKASKVLKKILKSV